MSGKLSTHPASILNATPLLRSRAFYCLIWLSLSTLSGLKIQLDFWYANQLVGLLPCLAIGGCVWIIWVRLFVLLLNQERWLTAAPSMAWLLSIHFLAGIGIALAVYIVKVFLLSTFAFLGWLPSFHETHLGLVANLLTYFTIAAIACAFLASRKQFRLESQKAMLTSNLAEAETRFLRSQLDPHLLFNLLNSIRLLIETDAAKADRFVSLVADFLRDTVDLSASVQVTIADELRLADKYLRIQRTRFGERIKFRFDVDSEANAALVPTLILQPLVENAVTHGLGDPASAGDLLIQTQRLADRVRIRVIDSGSGIEQASYRERIGLSSTRRRMELRFGKQGWTSISNLAAGGACVEIEFPFETLEGRADLEGK